MYGAFDSHGGTPKWMVYNWIFHEMDDLGYPHGLEASIWIRGNLSKLIWGLTCRNLPKKWQLRALFRIYRVSHGHTTIQEW